MSATAPRLPRRPLPPARPAARADGFSTVEVLVALVVLGLGILGLANLFPYGSQAQLRDRFRTSATELAQQKMEQLRLKSWDDPDMIDGIHPAAAGESLQIQNEGRYLRLWTVQTQAGAFADMKKVTVDVRWRFQRPDTVRLQSYFRR
jgi:Tfp pilus assembly protein PilV